MKTLTRFTIAPAAAATLALGMIAVPAEQASASPASSHTSASASGATSTLAKDYCGGSGISKWVPDHWFKAKFGSACKNHDQCYSHDSKTSRKTCDKRLLRDMAHACRKAYGNTTVRKAVCYDVTGHYYVGVRAGAKSHYKGSGNPA